MINLLPKDTVFFDLFENIAVHMVTAAAHLRSLAQTFPNTAADIQRIRNEEHQADELSHTALDRLDRTFITPFDREDIHELVGGLDDIVDHIDALAKRFPLFHIKAMQPEFVKQTEVLVATWRAVLRAVRLRRKRRKLEDLRLVLIDIRTHESIGDDNHHAAISRLFDG